MKEPTRIKHQRYEENSHQNDVCGLWRQVLGRQDVGEVLVTDKEGRRDFDGARGAGPSGLRTIDLEAGVGREESTSVEALQVIAVLRPEKGHSEHFYR